MADNIETPIVEPVVTQAEKPVVEPVVIKFEDFTPEQQAFIDRERTKASKTAREHAIKDPELISKAKELVESEARMTVEQKYEKMLADLSLRENSLIVKDKLRAGGVAEEAIEDVLGLLVNADAEKTLSNTDKFLATFKSAVEGAVSTKMQTAMKTIEKPKVTPPVTKAYKDMSYAERQTLKETDPTRFYAEMKAVSSKI